ncbi:MULTISPECIES: toll/interleukin-1 receptor domain-containing protein [unclassified Streptomyces]|uniref:TIR domain-containing protein n=1 Tax=Streptomyces sp. gb1(2016) TaxID=1828321 RepID=A0A652LD86_9ACTN|nr:MULTISPECIES: toll/interleukin-1 receptor domain-containing protein [unclassified Streptomyces]TXS33890.1 TIR domain-containing protein [Streptomyces sp. gb1(2016)]WSS74195.1 toll/interleukin-1 receptor domain-containing protein [Streptomyces sp. NBC_01174]WSS80397.1 toll/interleukin-1 receptor domain-containing protein [Streptomyces sp. NBC_01174]
MTDVFINYRTGDGEKTAALIDQELSRRFGRDRIFRASKSVAPGQAYPAALLNGLRRSAVLLAVIGPDWTNFRARLREPEDWVRQEILEAFACELPVVPVLDGRKTDRLNKADLPEELARLADLQSVPFSTHDTEAGLKRLGDVVADMVPGLRDLDRDAATPSLPDTVTNSIGDVGGTAVQSRDFTGDVGGTVIKGTNGGTIHTGPGDIYQNSRHVSGGRHFSGDGMTYFEGDHHGDIRHRFGGPERQEDDGR